jgi:uncharacterized membrane protein YkvA (DUF1232 family)
VAFEPPSYADALRNCVRGYEGSHARAVLSVVDIFEFFSHLFASPALPPSARPVINAVLAYFVAPNDVMSEEELGPFGLLDDIYVATHAYHLIRADIPEDERQRAWTGEGDLDEVMAMARAESRVACGKLARAALKMAGIA